MKNSPYIRKLHNLCIWILMAMGGSLFGQEWDDHKLKHLFEADDYRAWNQYKKTPIHEVSPQKWRNDHDIISGWDWSLPPSTKASPKAKVCIRRFSNLNVPLNKKLARLNLPIPGVVSLWIRWKQLEPKEGVYRFDSLKEMILDAKQKNHDVILRLLSSAKDFTPAWLEKYNIPVRKEKKDTRIINYEVSHPEFHSRYLKLVKALDESGIPKMDALVGAYVGYASPTYGDEGIGPHGQDPDEVPHVTERLRAWAEAFVDHEHKVFMGGPSQLGFELGFGIRRGFVEHYLYHLPDSMIGQKIDDKGYIWLDEKAPIIASGVYHGEENEEYEEAWATEKRGFRFGKTTDSYVYRYFNSNLRLLQMRCNYVLYNSFTIYPEQFYWVNMGLGRSVEDTPDVWCDLRESYLKPHLYEKATGNKAPVSIKKNGFATKNFERWLYQRDQKGAETKATVKIDHGVKSWMVHREKDYDYIARSGHKIGFAIDDRWLGKAPSSVAIKISYFDCGTGKLSLNFEAGTGRGSRDIPLSNSGSLKTATFFIDDFVSSAAGFDYDFTVEGIESKAVLAFMRVIKIKKDKEQADLTEVKTMHVETSSESAPMKKAI